MTQTLFASIFALAAVIAAGAAGALGPAEKKAIVRDLLKSLETRDPAPMRYVDDAKYIQHNPNVEDGKAGLKNLVARISKDTKIETVRLLADGDYVIAHSEFFLSGPKVAFDVFQFENGKIVEHWDNIQDKCLAPNKSGRTQLDGPIEVTDADRTQANKAVVKEYWDAVVLGGQRNRIAEFRSMDDFRQHNCEGEDNKSGAQPSKPGLVFKIEKVQKILGEGNFVLVMSQGLFGDFSTDGVLRPQPRAERQDGRALGRARADSGTGAIEEPQ